MMIFAFSVLWALAAAASSTSTASAADTVVTLSPREVKASKGKVSNDPLSNLFNEDSNRNVVVSPDGDKKFSVKFDFRYDGDISQVKGIAVRLSSVGTDWSRQKRTFHLRKKNDDKRNKKRRKKKFKWVQVATNKVAKNGQWQAQQWSKGRGAKMGPFFTNAGYMQIRVRSNNASGDVRIGLLAIDLTVGTGMGSGQWKPQASQGLTWQWQLTGRVDTSYDVDMYDIDLFDVPKSTIEELQSRGIAVVCYFSAGSYEDWREDWAQYFPDGPEGGGPFLGKMSGWDELWLDVSRLDELKPIMTSRLKLAAEKGCDGVEPDNMDAYTNTNDGLTYNHQLAYNRWIGTKARELGLSVALKNDLDQLADLVDYYDFAVNEQCFQYNECDTYKVFTAQDKAVFGVEYKGETSVFCPNARKMQLSWMKKRLNLNTWREAC